MHAPDKDILVMSVEYRRNNLTGQQCADMPARRLAIRSFYPETRRPPALPIRQTFLPGLQLKRLWLIWLRLNRRTSPQPEQ